MSTQTANSSRGAAGMLVFRMVAAGTFGPWQIIARALAMIAASAAGVTLRHATGRHVWPLVFACSVDGIAQSA